jgi:hypothetical protein
MAINTTKDDAKLLLNSENFQKKLQAKISQFEKSGFNIVVCTDRIPLTAKELAWKIENDLGISVLVEGNPSTRDHVSIHYKKGDIDREDLRKYLRSIAADVTIPRYDVFLSEDYYNEKIRIQKRMEEKEIYSKLKPLSSELYKVETIVDGNGEKMILCYGNIKKNDFLREAKKLGFENIILEEEYKKVNNPQQQNSAQSQNQDAFVLLRQMFTGDIQSDINKLQSEVSNKMDGICNDLDIKMKSISDALKSIEDNSDLQEMSKNVKLINSSVEQLKSSQAKASSELSAKIENMVKSVAEKLSQGLSDTSNQAIANLEQKIMPQVDQVKDAATKAASQQPILDGLKKDLETVSQATKRIENAIKEIDSGLEAKVKKTIVEQIPKIEISVKG